MTDSPMRSLMGIDDHDTPYPAIMASILKDVNFREFSVGKKVLKLIGEYKALDTTSSDGKADADEILDHEKFYNNAKTKTACGIPVETDLRMEVNNWAEDYWMGGSVKYKSLECYMGNLNRYNYALDYAIKELQKPAP